MKETLRHQEAFEYYYLLGNDRSYPQVASKFTVSLTSVKKWAKEFKWQQRVQDRDTKNAITLSAKTDFTIIEVKTKYLNLIGRTLSKYEEALQSGNINISSVQDLEKLAKLEMFLRKDETTKEDTNVNIIFKRVETENISNK